jgi:hypothetical protein
VAGRAGYGLDSAAAKSDKRRSFRRCAASPFVAMSSSFRLRLPLAGVRYVSADNRQFPSTAVPALTATGDNLSFSVGAYYPTGYAPTAVRELYSRPTVALLDLILGYEHKLGRKLSWSTQLNVTNLFNHYKVLVRPNNITGYSGINTALFTNQPREYTWSNTIKF